MLKDKLLTVIIPGYNCENTIKTTLDSVFNQKFTNLKVCFVDDGSTDRTAEIVKTYVSTYPNMIEYHYKENGGISNARNYGLDTLTTSYFTFLDSDDFIDQSMYQEMMELIMNKDANIVMCGFWWEYPHKQIAVKDGPYKDQKDILTHMFATLWNKIYKTEWIKSTNLRFPEKLRYEDASFLYRLVPHMNHVVYIDKPFVHYMQREGSITHTFNTNVNDMMEVFTGIKKYYQDIQEYDVYAQEIEYLYIRFFLGNSYLRTAQIKDKKIRNDLLNKSWTYLNENFPNWKSNHYIKEKGKKNLYFRIINKCFFYLNAKIINVVFRFKKNYK